ncbi:Phosphoribosylformylglycinamidine synthase [Escherichia coli]|uniref:Phosphoribosylformylglycinamidine synthase n=1 Tax=Escherichia coli TaxID=562 RepID=A0A377AK63_ECOLX|nr:Phosphoribosylformylglycinamidine synthase [Escherichia coli]
MARFVRNTSDRFEARFSLVEVTQSPSLLLQGMVGSQMPIAVSHGEGRVEVRDAGASGGTGKQRAGGTALCR